MPAMCFSIDDFALTKSPIHSVDVTNLQLTHAHLTYSQACGSDMADTDLLPIYLIRS